MKPPRYLKGFAIYTPCRRATWVAQIQLEADFFSSPHKGKDGTVTVARD